MKITPGKFPLTPLFVTGLLLLLASNTVNEIIGIKWVFYVMIIVGVAFSIIDITRYFRGVNKQYLIDLEKIRRSNSSKNKEK